jgi:ferritin-like metal-binding protein YciE
VALPETPGETWDFTATQPIILAALQIGGRSRKVLMQAPKNGFFYVLDRTNGELISAKNFVPVTWASGIDMKTGRPIETANARFTEGEQLVAPSALGAHNWHPMAFSPKTGLVYLPAQEVPFLYADDANYKPRPGAWNIAVDAVKNIPPGDPAQFRAIRAILKGQLIAWDPVAQKEVWRAQYDGPWNGGALATAGDLVFQGNANGQFQAFNATDGRKLWSFEAQTGVIAGPVSYSVGGQQYVAVMAGYGGAYPLSSPFVDNPRVMPNGRVLVFKLGGNAALPAPRAHVGLAGQSSSGAVHAGGAGPGAAGLRKQLQRLPWPVWPLQRRAAGPAPLGRTGGQGALERGGARRIPEGPRHDRIRQVPHAGAGRGAARLRRGPRANAEGGRNRRWKDAQPPGGLAGRLSAIRHGTGARLSGFSQRPRSSAPHDPHPEPRTMPKSLDDLFLHMLKDVYHAEKQVNRALPKVTKQVGDEQLKAALGRALDLTHENVERIEQAFDALGKPKKGIPCEAMQGIIAELQEAVEDSEGDVLDAGVLAAVQTINHYQIVRYGTLRAWGEELGQTDAAEAMRASTEASREMDQALTQLAEGRLNQEAEDEEEGGEETDENEGETVKLEGGAKPKKKAPAKK